MTLALLISLTSFYSHIQYQSKFHSSSLLLSFPIFVQPSLKTHNNNNNNNNKQTYKQKKEEEARIE